MPHLPISVCTKLLGDTLSDVYAIAEAGGFSSLELHLRPARLGEPMMPPRNIRIPIVDGGWCDFLAGDTDSVREQVQLASKFGASYLRLFLGRAEWYQISPRDVDQAVQRLQIVAAESSVCLLLETHDGVSADPDKLARILREVASDRLRVLFDPINVMRAGFDPQRALTVLDDLIAWAHLKGWNGSSLCTYGDGEYDLTPTVKQLQARGVPLSLEYEGSGNPLVQLHRGYANLLETLL